MSEVIYTLKFLYLCLKYMFILQNVLILDWGWNGIALVLYVWGPGLILSTTKIYNSLNILFIEEYICVAKCKHYRIVISPILSVSITVIFLGVRTIVSLMPLLLGIFFHMHIYYGLHYFPKEIVIPWLGT